MHEELVRAETAFGDIQREVARAEADVQLVRDRAARDRARLDSGVGTSKDLTALQHELESLARRQSALEDIELEVMERAENAEADVRRLSADRDGLVTRVEEIKARRDAALADLDAETEKVATPRESIAGEVGEDLVALYEKIRATSGTGAAPLRQRRCGGCQLELNNVDLSRIRNAGADEVLRCEECRRILVRTPESGI